MFPCPYCDHKEESIARLFNEHIRVQHPLQWPRLLRFLESILEAAVSFPNHLRGLLPSYSAKAMALLQMLPEREPQVHSGITALIGVIRMLRTKEPVDTWEPLSVSRKLYEE